MRARAHTSNELNKSQDRFRNSLNFEVFLNLFIPFVHSEIKTNTFWIYIKEKEYPIQPIWTSSENVSRVSRPQQCVKWMWNIQKVKRHQLACEKAITSIQFYGMKSVDLYVQKRWLLLGFSWHDFFVSFCLVLFHFFLSILFFFVHKKKPTKTSSVSIWIAMQILHHELQVNCGSVNSNYFLAFIVRQCCKYMLGIPFTEVSWFIYRLNERFYKKKKKKINSINDDQVGLNWMHEWKWKNQTILCIKLKRAPGVSYLSR